jgi:glyoxylase-like metal-dependent hydrolase (beta-lactamase superfamily II)
MNRKRKKKKNFQTLFRLTHIFRKLATTNKKMASTKVMVTSFADGDTGTGTHVVADPETRKCAIIDPVLNYSARSGRTSTDGVDTVLAYIEEQGYTVQWILETHAHADHATGANVLKQKTSAPVAIGERIDRVQATFKPIFNLGDDEVPADGSSFDRLWADGDTFSIGNVAVRVMHTPGHTPACVSYYVEDDAVFVGDTMFMPDQGTARCDFPEGSAEQLWTSIGRILALPGHVRVFVGHDYRGVDKKREHVSFETTVAAEKQSSIHIAEGTTREQFIERRTTRDATLDHPALILPALQINIRAGRFPSPESNGVSYLKIPLNKI